MVSVLKQQQITFSSAEAATQVEINAYYVVEELLSISSVELPSLPKVINKISIICLVVCIQTYMHDVMFIREHNHR